MKCKKCANKCIKKGFQQNRFYRKQRYQCKECKTYQLEEYSYRIYSSKSDQKLIQLNAEGNSISGMARILEYSKQTIIRRIQYLAERVKPPIVSEYHQTYEVDELWTYVGNKETGEAWITYAINRKTNKVISFNVGGKTTRDMAKVILPVKQLYPKRIVTDKLNIYPNLVKPIEHDTRKHRNNHIERANLTLRQHLRRLSRKTLAYSKSLKMLEASLKLYLFWNSWVIGGK
ncbi:IS1 family transposase [Parvicella tangerina]|uniref:IS1 family transposase n=1 Tax=Parvicella tangerina TaxID=2829795 RepID=A0A916JRG6_9FLAO|nr:IS1 family transposase [Parvicella tangerina]CAG5087376.1 hypothetical protein CRYO30217_03467 [Parvicella tangerina]